VSRGVRQKELRWISAVVERAEKFDVNRASMAVGRTRRGPGGRFNAENGYVEQQRSNQITVS